MTDEELFLTTIFDCSRSDLLMRPRDLATSQKERLEVMRRRRASGEPVQYICGFTEFMGHRIEVGQGVLVPRPETEVLVDAVIQRLKDYGPTDCLVLDIGTGSGCIPVALVKGLPSCRAIGLDVSAEALCYARGNAAINEVSGRIEFVERDMSLFLDETAYYFDLIISNPPYVPSFMVDQLPKDVQQEPLLALDGGSDGLHFFRYIIPKASQLLKPGGLLALEFGDGQCKELENLFAIGSGWDKIQIIQDNAGKDRIVLAQKSTD